MAAKKSAGVRPQITIRESGERNDWAWAYRTTIMGGLGISIALAGFIGRSVLANLDQVGLEQRQMSRDVSDLKSDLTSRISGMDSAIGDARGRIDMLQNRANRMGDALNKSNQDIAVLQQRMNDLQAKLP